MKTTFFKMAMIAFIVALCSTVARSQEGKYFQLGVSTGTSSPRGDYKNGIGRARNGYTGGLTADYYFLGGLGIGIDARFTQHPHQMPDTIFQQGGNYDTYTTANSYSSPLRFRHFGITLGPVYHIGEGSLGIDLYARGGMLFEQFPTYVRKETIVIDNPFSNFPPVTFVFDRSAARTDRTSSWTALMGAKISYEIFPRFGIFLYGDYQTALGNKGRFTVEDLQNGQSPQNAPIKMVSFGGGLRLTFGDGRDDSSLSRNY